MKFSRLVVACGLSLVSFAPLATLVSPATAATEQTVLLCEGSSRTTARIYRSNGVLKMRLYDRLNKTTWFNSAALDQTNPESYVYVNERGEGTYKVSAFRNGGKDCSISISGKPPERGRVK
jgi:hypothetical protein